MISHIQCMGVASHACAVPKLDIMRLLADIHDEVQRIRSMLEDDDGEEEEVPEDDA